MNALAKFTWATALTFALLIASIALLASVLWTGRSGTATPTVVEPYVSADAEGQAGADLKAEAAILATRIPIATFRSREKLQEALRAAAAAAHCQVQIQSRWLEIATLDPDAVVTLDWAAPGIPGDVPLGTALRWILSDIEGFTGSLGFTVDHGVLIVTTDDQLAKHTIPVVYNVRDLIDISMTSQPKLSRPEAIDEITRLIIDTVARDSWTETGGVNGSLRVIAELLIVTQTPPAHRQIVDLLTALRQTSRSRPATQPALAIGTEPSIAPSIGERPAVVLEMIEKFQPDDGATYERAISALAEQVGIKIHVDWRSLGMFGAGAPSAAVDDALPIEHVSIAEAIRRIVVPDEDVESLSFRMTGDVVVVSIDQMTQVYNVRDLINVGATHRQNAWPEDELIAAIMGSIDRDTWTVNGGTIGWIDRLSSGLLVVTQTRAGQVHVVEFLRKLRAANAK